jgi:hypothetical protein
MQNLIPMVLTVVLVLFLGLLVYLLLMPLELCIDTFREKYYLRMGLLARISVEKDPVELVRLHLKVLFMHFSWRPADLRSWGSKTKKTTKKAKKTKKRHMTLARGMQLIQSFRVKAFRLELDTGNPVLNAQLFPIFFLTGQQGGDVGINFLGRNNILLQITNRPIYILNTFINPKK